MSVTEGDFDGEGLSWLSESRTRKAIRFHRETQIKAGTESSGAAAETTTRRRRREKEQFPAANEELRRRRRNREASDASHGWVRVSLHFCREWSFRAELDNSV